ncbi:hypothetical protein HYS47_02005 [Candidatus Woesearchaeota archaeon]|nr:hypothetical protein [Candidatus Woesearchaeota archaeon]
MKNIPSVAIIATVVVVILSFMGCSSLVQDKGQPDESSIDGLPFNAFSGWPVRSIAYDLSNRNAAQVQSRWVGFIPPTCSKLSDDTWPTKDLLANCFTTTISGRKLRIINDLDPVTSGSAYYENKVLRVVKYNNVMSIVPSNPNVDDLDEIIAVGTELLEPDSEPVSSPSSISASGSQQDFTITGSSTSSITYDLGIMIGYWDDEIGSSADDNLKVRHMDGVITCEKQNGDYLVGNKIRFFRITHPANKRVTIRLSGLFPDYSFPEEGYCPVSYGFTGT